MRPDIYICSKPLQYFNVRNMDSLSVPARRILVFLGTFIDAEAFVRKVRAYDTSWNDILYFENYFQLDRYLFFHPANRLFVECDASFMYGIFSKLGRFREMYMFEEGFGSYRRDRFDQSTGLKAWINRRTGVGRHIGFSSFLSGQYLYLPDLYRRQFPGYTKELRPFSKPFLVRLSEELPLFLKYSTGYEDLLHIKGKRIGIYLTNHKINASILEALEKERDKFDYLYVKPHPHIRVENESSLHGLRVIRTNLMVEFVLSLLLDNGNQLTVYHENSTSVIWFQNHVVCKNWGKPFEEYDIVASYIRERGL